nr:TPA_asm: L [Chelidonium alphacytorhabdovirus 1]
MSYFYGGSNDDDDIPTVHRTVLPDYHLRNPLRIPTWLDDNSNRLPLRQRKDKAFVRSYYPGARWGKPYSLNRRIAPFIPNMPVDKYGIALSDLRLRLSLDNDLFPRDSQAPVEAIISSLSHTESRYWNGMRFWNRVLLILNALSSERELPAGTSERYGMAVYNMMKGASLVICRTCVIFVHQGLKELFDSDWVRMVSDINTQRFLLMTSAKIGREINRCHYLEEDSICAIFDWGDDVLENKGNDGFKLLKAYEAIVIGYLQTRGEGSLIDNRRFLDNTLKDLAEDDAEFLAYGLRLISMLHTMESFHHISQAYGMHRAWGHPTVDSRKGMDKLRLIGRKEIIKDDTLSKDAGRMFKLLFAREYLKKYGHFPKVREGSFTLLETKILDNDSSAVNKTAHLLSEWDRITFSQTFDLPESFNLSMIIADKAISPTRTELARSISSRNTVMDPDKRRGVKRWLEDTTLKPKAFLAEINNGIFDNDHKIIGLTPKERELNPTPRMFSLMSHQLRVYVVVTEQMLSDHILKMFPQITMTDSLLDLTKKMYATVKNQSSRVKRHNRAGSWVSRVICMSLDFEKWNGHMRKEMTLGVFSALGTLFGLPELYNMTYDLFEECYYYLADGSYVPKLREGELVVEEPLSFTGHKGGMEGLRQKGWTIYTVCCLEVILSKYDCTYKIMGMGDNQVLQITVYSKKLDTEGRVTAEGIAEMRTLIGTIFNDLVHSFTQAGLPLKPLETWMSEDLYLYGKVPMWKGVPLTMDMKKLMRTFPMSNEDIMTIENALGTVSSNATAATQAGPCVWTAYCIAILMSSLCIQDFSEYHPLLGKGMNSVSFEKDRWVLAMSQSDKMKYDIRGDGVSDGHLRLLIQLIPKSLGGYNGINIYELMMRGFPDNASRDICYLTKILNSECMMGWMRDCIKCWLTPIYMPNINYSTLLEDVTALNLLSPRSPTSGIRQLVAKYMSSGVNITNDEFKDLMSSKYKNMSDYLSECLCEGAELHIRLLHDIYESTIFGYVDGILSKVVKTSTIQKLAINDSRGAVFQSIDRDEINFHRYFRWRCVQMSGEYEEECPTSRCKRIRLEGWRKELRGVTTPFPAAYMRRTECGETGVCTCNDGYMSVHFPDGQLTNDMWNFDIGGNPPYLGSTTKEKVIIGAGGRIYSGEPLVRRPITLLKTINWFVPPDSKTAEVIKTCVRAVTDLDPEPYQGVSEGTAGSEVHRYRDSSTTHGALTSSNFLFSTRYHISTDNFTRYSKGSENTDIHYQALFCYILESSNMMISTKLRTGDVTPRFDHYHQCCYECINPIPEDFKDLESLKAIDAVPKRVNNPYLFVSKDKIRILERISPLSELSERHFDSAAYARMDGTTKIRWLQDVICDRIVSDLMGNTMSDTHASVGLLDVKSYERTMYLKFSPKYMIHRLISQLWKVARWKSREAKGLVKYVGDADILRAFTNIITSSDDHAFMGIAMFYCWEETSKRINIYPEMIVPNTNPISISSACQAMRSNILSLVNTRRWTMADRQNIVTEDEKYSSIVYKLILSDWVEKFNDCQECKISCDLMNGKNLDWDIKHTICRNGHIFWDRLRRYPWIRSSVTVERLRKDGLASQENDPRLILSVPKISFGFYIELSKDSTLRMRFSVKGYQTDSGEYDYSAPESVIKYSLLTLKSLPTVSWYKCTDIYNIIRKELKDQSVFCVGDGLGSSSSIISSLGVKEVIVSTILNPDDAIPQTYVHNVSPITVEYNSAKVNDKLMINRSNNITDQTWSRDWSGVTKHCSVLISDVEVTLKDGKDIRQRIFENLLSLNDWDCAVVKDYLYAPSDYVNRIGTMNNACTSWRLVTTRFRSSYFPEVWWILTGVVSSKVKRDGQGVSVDWRNCLGLWGQIRQELESRYDDERIDKVTAEKIRMMSPAGGGMKMMTYLRTWATFPIVGSLLPEKGAFTKMFLYMKKSKRPEHVKLQRESNKLKLYDSDYYRLRERIFAMAVAMLADIDDRYTMLNESEYWHLEWFEKKKDSWWCKLKRYPTEPDLKCLVSDYIPVLCLLMRQQSLIFRNCSRSFEFKPQSGNRDDVFFPISKNAAAT